MKELVKIFRQFLLAFSKMSPAQKASVGLVFFSSIIVIVAMVLWLSQPDFTILYANIDPSEAASIKEKLDEMNIPVKIKGSVIMVPAKNVYEARLALAQEGLPRGNGVGYEIFDSQSPLGVSNYLQQINYKRALEGELSRTISTIKGIRQARVHLALPKRELFAEEQIPPSASVVVDAGLTLSKRQLRAIVHLVASSVEGLKPENVTVVDTYGNLLYSGFDSTGGLSDAQLDIKRSVEKYLEQKASSMLSGVLGPGKAVVRVNADLDFTRIEKTEEKYDPEGLVPRSEESSREILPSANGQGNKEHTITNYEVSRTVAHIIGPSGNLRRLAVAVVVDGKYEVEDGKRKYVPRSKEEMKKIRDLVAQAVGLDPKRGDTITISEIPFDKSELEEEQKASERDKMFSMAMEIGKYLGGILLILIAIVMLQNTIRTISQSLPKPVVEVKPSSRVNVPREPDISEVVGENYDLAADVVREYIEGQEEG